ncbi:site-specific DNA-methyltransferase [Candidatus Bathyarchaeota archaeon]|nr:MAG: site-specific DNA-methyltransferase [Candidatus Bathyarchaeota archaeon]
MARSSISPDIGGLGGEAVVYTFTVCETESCSKMQKTEAKLSPHNKLNDLTGREWIKFTKSWFIHRPERRADAKILHPASFPESLAKEFILFFTKRGDTVVDPFLGTGSSLVACLETGRNGVGIEVMEKYSSIAESRLRIVAGEADSPSTVKVLHVGLADYCITSPPYWNQLKRSDLRQKKRVELGYDTNYGDNPEDVGLIEDYEEFLAVLKQVFNEVYRIMKPKGYLTIITNNVFQNGRLYPLAFDTVRTLAIEPCAWVPKDEKIWCQDDKALLPLGVNSAWVGNRHHQYCLIFRKETRP